MALKRKLGFLYPKVFVTLGLIIAIYSIVWIVPFSPYFPNKGLDPSWATVIEHSLLNQLTFGEDIIFTYGPLGFLATKQFQQNLYPIALLYWLLAAITISFLLFNYLRSGNYLITTITYLLFILATSLNPNIQILILPLVLALLETNTFKPRPNYITSLLIILCGIACLIKGTVIFLTLPIFIMLDIRDLVRKKYWPRRILLLFGTIIAALFISGQPLSKMGTFFVSILEISKGYSSAMQAIGPLNQIIAFLGLAMILGLIMLIHITRKKINWDDSIAFLSILLFLFLAFKQGFVRHDGHATTSGGAILIAASLLVMYLYAKRTFKSLKVISLIVTASSLAFCLYIINFYWHLYPQKLLKDKFISQPKIALQQTKGFVFKNKLNALKKRRLDTISSIAEEHPLPHLEGSVDIFPWDQAIVLANSLNYNPRPIFQSYSVYTPTLIKKNIQHLTSSKAADYLFFDIKTIDNRYPTLDDGALWPTIWRYYDPIDQASDFLILSRRSSPREVSIDEIAEGSSIIGQHIAVPESDKPVWVKVKMPISPLGKLRAFVFRQSMLKIEVTFDNGTKQLKRFVPTMTSEGFLLSPYIVEEKEFAALLLSLNTKEGFSRRVVQARVLGSKLAKFSFKEKIYWEFNEVNISPSFEAANSREFTEAILAWPLTRNKMLSLGNQDPRWVRIVGEELFAHAPSKLPLPFSSAEKLSVKFGLRDGAWQEGSTDGVLFKISLLDSKEQVEIWSRLLNPKEIALDRGEQTVNITLPQAEGTLIFETKPHKNNAWDWSYWSRIQFE